MTDDTRLTTPIPVEFKFSSNATAGAFTGYASTWGGPPDSYGDIIERGAFVDCLKHTPAMLWAHDQAEPIGKWDVVREDDRGLYVEGRLALGIKRAKDAYELLKERAIALSIGFVIAKGGATTARGVRTIKRVERLPEISLVACPANVNATVTAVKRVPATPREFERLLRDAAGFSAREAKRATAGGWPALVREERPDIDAVLAEIRLLRDVLNERG